MKNVSNTLNDLRQRMKQVKLIDLSSASGFHRNTLRGIQNGVIPNPGIHTVEKISAALDAMNGVADND